MERICVFPPDYHEVTWKVEISHRVGCWFCVYFRLSLVNLSVACCSFHFQLRMSVLLLFVNLRHQAVVHLENLQSQVKSERQRERRANDEEERLKEIVFVCVCMWERERERKRALLIHSFQGCLYPSVHSCSCAVWGHYHYYYYYSKLLYSVILCSRADSLRTLACDSEWESPHAFPELFHVFNFHKGWGAEYACSHGLTLVNSVSSSCSTCVHDKLVHCLQSSLLGSQHPQVSEFATSLHTDD